MFSRHKAKADSLSLGFNNAHTQCMIKHKDKNQSQDWLGQSRRKEEPRGPGLGAGA